MLSQKNERVKEQDSTAEPALGQVTIGYTQNEQRDEEGRMCTLKYFNFIMC